MPKVLSKQKIQNIKKCKFCDKEFNYFYSTDKYCSLACTINARKKNCKERTNKISKRCKQCGEHYDRYFSVIKFRGSNFCSIKCKKRFARDNKTLSQVKKIVWDLFSKYIRQKYSDANGNVKCCTCSQIKHWKQMQAGHFVPKARGNAVYFEEDNVHPQCMHCNINLGSNASAYALFIIKKYGVEKISELEALSETTVRFTIDELERMGEIYKGKTKLLQESLN